MLNVNVMPRKSGKTTMIKGIILSKNYKCILLVPDKSFINRFDDLFMNGKIFTFHEFMNNTDLIKSKNDVNTIIIEEGFLSTPEEIIKLYYHIGCFFSYNTDIQVFGTPASDEMYDNNKKLFEENQELKRQNNTLQNILNNIQGGNSNK